MSCVEAGRWDGGRHREEFDAAPQAAYPELRRMKSMQARARVAAGHEARADQGAVWNEVAAKAARMGISSATGAMHDIYEGRRDRLAEIRDAIRLHDGQLGAVVAINGEIQVMDLVSRPATFAVLHGPLVQGYALDALESGAESAAARRPGDGERLQPAGHRLHARPSRPRRRPRRRHVVRRPRRLRHRPRPRGRADPADRVPAGPGAVGARAGDSDGAGAAAVAAAVNRVRLAGARDR